MSDKDFELSHDYIRGIIAGRDYEREISSKAKSCREAVINDVLSILGHKIDMINDVQPKMSANAQILLDYQRKIIHSLIKDVNALS